MNYSLTQLDEGVERSDASQHAGQLVAADVGEPFVQSVLHQSVEAQQTAGAGRERERERRAVSGRPGRGRSHPAAQRTLNVHRRNNAVWRRHSDTVVQ